MDFDPIIPSDNKDKAIKRDEIVEVKKDSNLSKDPLSITNLVSNSISHMVGDDQCRKDIDFISKELSTLIDKMSVKELIEYYKVKLKEREFHTDCIFKALNFTLKTQYAKHLLVGSEKDNDKSIINISDKGRIQSLSNFLADD